MKKNIKKIILLASIILAIGILVIAGYYAYSYFKPYNVIKESGVSFKYPKGLEIEKDESSQYAGYAVYRIRTKFMYDSFPQESQILIEIPIVDKKIKGGSYSLQSVLQANGIKKENYIMPIKEIDINGNKGQIAKYRQSIRENIYSTFLQAYIKFKYDNSFIKIIYEEKDTDPDSLDEAWEMILTSLKF